MAFGKKKTKTPQFYRTPAPAPAITQVETRSPFGDRYITRSEGGALINETILSPQSAQWAQDARGQLGELTRSLGTGDAARAADIQRLSGDLYAQEADSVNRDAAVATEKARSQLAQRFGGALNATFGLDLLARLDSNRLDGLSQARQRARATAESMNAQDEASRLRRATLLMDALNQVTGASQTAGGAGSSLLAGELRRAQDVAESRARLLANYEDARNAARERRSDLLTSLMMAGGRWAGGALGGYLGAPALGRSIGGILGESFSNPDALRRF